jgi:hypothetical protein
MTLEPQSLQHRNHAPSKGETFEQADHVGRVGYGIVIVLHQRNLGLSHPEGVHITRRRVQAGGKQTSPANTEEAEACWNKKRKPYRTDERNGSLDRQATVSTIVPSQARRCARRFAPTEMKPVPTVYRVSQSCFSAVWLHSAAFSDFFSYFCSFGMELEE